MNTYLFQFSSSILADEDLESVLNDDSGITDTEDVRINNF